jgi:hypothetical protein
MRVLGTIVVAGLLATIAASAQPVSPACSLVCLPPSHLNEKKCACEEAIARKPACSLVCLNPDETLDARKCACVHKR